MASVGSVVLLSLSAAAPMRPFPAVKHHAAAMPIAAAPALQVSGHASSAFVSAVVAQVATLPSAMRADLAADGYRIEANESVRQGRPDLDAENDFTGGLHSRGPKGRFIVVAEKVKNALSGQWESNKFWENGVTHEIGHALAYIMGAHEAKSAPEPLAKWYRDKGVSESPEFRDAYKKDFDAMPAALKAEKGGDGKPNPFHYFTKPDANGWFQRARQEAFAEAFDVVMRGAGSTYNYALFTKRFPSVLAAVRAALERRYGPLLQ